MSNQIFIGLDIGGSSSILYATDSSAGWDEPALTLEHAGANLKRVGLDRCASTIVELIDAARAKYSDTVVYASAGVAGASTPEERHRLEAAVSNKVEGRIQVVPDARLALETAFPGESGLIIIAGTGSIVYARTTENRYVRAGGWGAIIGDEGGGYGLAIAGLKAVANALDGGPSTRLQEEFLKRDISTRKDILATVYGDEARPQKLAPVVIECAEANDEVASAVLQEQISILADQASWVAARYQEISPRLCGLGGLMHHDLYRSTLRTALHERMASWTVNFSTESPALGALYLATRLVIR